MEQFGNSETTNVYLKDIENKYLLDNQSVYLMTNDIKENENMADMKKFLSTEGLSALVDQIKAEDAKVKAYVDQHIENAGKTYDVAGAAATVQGKLDEEVTRAKAREDAIAAAAESAQTDVDNLAKLVGTLPEGTTAKDVVDYVNVKTAGITPFGIGAIPTPDVAVVGQTIVVKEVDENGRPIGWEAADFPTGGSGGGELETIADFTATEGTTEIRIPIDTEEMVEKLRKASEYRILLYIPKDTEDSETNTGGKVNIGFHIGWNNTFVIDLEAIPAPSGWIPYCVSSIYVFRSPNNSLGQSSPILIAQARKNDASTSMLAQGEIYTDTMTASGAHYIYVSGSQNMAPGTRFIMEVRP